MSKRALITGITGQDGSYLAELLISKDYQVHGVIRKSSTDNLQRIAHLNLTLHYGDLAQGIDYIIDEVKPEEIYNLASMSQVRVSFEIPEYTADINALGTLRILEAIRRQKLDTRFYQASTSEIYGSTPPPQDENSPMCPVSPYGCAKLFGYWITKIYRTAYKIFASNGILFNHESERRSIDFVTRKIVRGAVRIKKGLQDKLYLGNLDAERDWGHARDYVKAMWMILQHSQPDDFVVSTGESHSIKEFLEETFRYLDMDWQEYVEIKDIYFRPNEVEKLCGNPQKIMWELNWKPIVKFQELVKIMVDAEWNIYQ